MYIVLVKDHNGFLPNGKVVLQKCVRIDRGIEHLYFGI